MFAELKGMMPLLALVGCSLLFSACSPTATLLDAHEGKLGIRDNELGSDHRAFHSILHFPHGIGLNFPGYIVGIEKAGQNLIGGPRVREELYPVRGDAEPATHRRIRSNSKAHFISHVMKYSTGIGDHRVFGGRIQPCAIYSVLGSSFAEPNLTEGRVPDGERTLVGSNQFEFCEGFPRNESGAHDSILMPRAYHQSGEAIMDLRSDINRHANRNKFTHILVMVMGWNTPQSNAVQNFNSIMGHLLDEYEDTYQERCTKTDLEEICSFHPLVVGVTWSSDWQLSSMSPIPPTVVRTASFLNKANDAEEVGVTWLADLLRNGILPARSELADDASGPKVVLIGHSFGARATLAALVQETFHEPAIKSSFNEQFQPGDTFLALQGAFEVKELFKERDLNKGLSAAFDRDGLRAVLTATQFDKAVKFAFWADFAGSLDGFDAVCGDLPGDEVDCFEVGENTQRNAELDSYGLAACVTNEDPILLETRATKPNFSHASVLESDHGLIYVNTSRLMNCNAAFTGGGAHSDIYRRETARFVMDVLLPRPFVETQ